MQNTHAYQWHQDLVVGGAGSGVHAVQAVEQAHDLLLIEIGNRRHDRSPQRVLHIGAECLVGVERRRRTQEWVLLATVHRIGNHITDRFPQNVLFCHAPNLLIHRLLAYSFDDTVIKERHPALDRMSHLHPVAEHGENVVGEYGLSPQV